MEKQKENIQQQTHTSKSMELPNPNRRVDVNREEGELSSSDNEENPVSSASQSPGIVNQLVSAGSTRLSQSDKFMQGAQADGVISGNKSASFVNVNPLTSARPSDDKIFGKHQGTFKSSNPGWSAPSDVNNNLVIRFSDDSDSDSDFEDQKRQKALESKHKKSMFSSSRKPPLLQSSKPTTQHNVRSAAKVTSRKIPMSRTFMPSTAKKTGGINLSGSGMLLVNQGSQVRDVNNVNKSVSYQQQGIEAVGTCTSKLQDLRQQIALRERELKLRASQQYREIVSVPGSNYKAICPYGDASKRPVPLSANIGQSEHKEPERKRLKSSGTYSSQLKTNGHEKPATKNVMPSKTRQTVDERNMLDCRQKGSDRRLESGVVEHVDKSQSNPPIGLQGADVYGAHSKSEKSRMQTDPHVMLHETAPQVSTRSPCNLEKTSAYPENINLWNFFCPANVEQSDMDSLTEMEEALEKELDEAQGTRRRCEIEERKAFKAYQKAQRALIEANSRCTELYRRRELCSARFHSMITGATSLSWSSRQHETGGTRYPACTGSRNLDLVPTSSHHQQTNYDHCSLPVSGLNISWGGAGKKTSSQQLNGHVLGSEPCSEPDASTSDPLQFRSTRDAANVACSPSNDPNMLVEEDGEASSMDRQRRHSGLKDQWKRQDGDTKHEPYQRAKTGSQDSLALEAALRSQLFSRLGVRTLSKNNNSCNVEPAEESSPENGGSEKTQASNDCVPFSDAEKNQECNLGGHCELERSGSGSPVRVQKSQKIPSDSHCAVDNGHHMGDIELTNSVSCSPSLVLRSAFDHMKVMSGDTSFALQSDKTSRVESFDHNEDDGCINAHEHFTSLMGNSITKSIRDIFGGETGSFVCTFSVDPFWPLCMYELRGRCNNDECPWQHFRDFCNGNVCQRQPDDCETSLTLDAHGETNHSKGLNMLSPPTYLVGLDVLKAGEHSSKPVVGWKDGQCWDKCFSLCLVVSSLLQKCLSSDETLMHGLDGRIEVIGDWYRQSSCIQSTKRLLTLVSNASAKNIPPLEMALLTLTQEVIKLKGKKEVLAILAKAVENDPTSEILWIVYLLIYYHDGKTVQDDDMFFHAVKKTKGSYGLWLLYINSRLHLDSRLHAYDDAIAALCATTSTAEKQLLSACILDLLLQMMDCLCISGNVERAVQRISAFLTVTTNSDEPHSSLLSDILACLTIPDTYMFWICCIYLVVYRKLPDAVVEQFEREKEILTIEWPTVHLQDDEKEGVVNLVERIFDSVELYVSGESPKSEANLKSAQHFAVSHIRLMVALHGIQCYQNILDKYIKLYPSSLELVLLLARLQANDEKGSRFVGFEETLANWPQNTPGIHCIWNQYAECALQKGHVDLAKEIVSRWFSSSKFQYSQDEMLGVTHGSLEVAAASFSFHADKIDTIFRDLNLCLAKILQNDHVESRLAIDRALIASAAPFFKHCLREHATFMAMYELQLKRGDFGKEHFKVLGSYLKTIKAQPASQPLSRHFIKEIEKPRIQQLINNILSPISTDFHLINSVLEAWYGPSLVPQNVSQPKELVDFVEAILEMVPSNYELAISVCKLLLSRGKSADVPSCSMLYWASSTLVNALFHAVPVAPEYAWVETAGILGNTSGIELIFDKFYKRALSVYPFSIRLWNCYYNQAKVRGDASGILEAAQKWGIVLT